MIKKLRFKFIFVSLLSVLLILGFTVASINIYNFVKIENDSSFVLEKVIEQGFNEEIAPPPFEEGVKEGKEGPRDDEGLIRQHYFLVELNSSNEVVNKKFNHIFSISEEEGIKLAIEAVNGSQTSGKVNTLRYLVKKETNTFVAFLDLNEQIMSAKSFLSASSIISSGAYLLLVALIFILFHFVFKPTEESYRKQKEFITNASHELKTPLTIISTDLEIIEMDNGKSERSESIRDQVDRLTTMVNQLVILSRLDEDNLKNYPVEEFDLSVLAKKSIESYKQSFKKENILFNYEVEDNVIINANKFLLDELFYIFFDNALKYAKRGGELSFILKKASKTQVFLLFSNDIEEDSALDESLIFERFYRGEERKSPGSGIGLSMAKEIVLKHKGKIEAKKENNKLIFKIIL